MAIRKPVSRQGSHCLACRTPLLEKKVGNDIFKVHTATGTATCPEVEFCKTAAPTHILSDGTPCQDPRHTDNPEWFWPGDGPFFDAPEQCAWIIPD